MVTNEDLFKREEDRKWRLAVDHQLVTVMTGHQVLDRRLTDIEEAIKDLDLILRGDPTQDKDGVITQLHQIQTSMAKLNAVVFVDSTGRKGLQHEVETLLTGEQRMEYKWKFLTSVVVALLSLIGLLATNWDRITSYFNRPSKDPLNQMIEDAKPKKIYRHYTIRERED